MSSQLSYYHKKKQNPEWYAKELERKREYTNKRYQENEGFRNYVKNYYKDKYKNDPDFRESEKIKAKERYYKRKNKEQDIKE